MKIKDGKREKKCRRMHKITSNSKGKPKEKSIVEHSLKQKV